MPIRLILSMLFACLCDLAIAQTQPKTMVILDSSTRQPLPYVSVLPDGGRGFVGDGQAYPQISASHAIPVSTGGGLRW